MTEQLPGGGPAPLITLRTIPPLPAFRIPHGIPQPETPISSFKLAILRILMGQTHATSSTKPLTYSEELKQKTINGWRMQMLSLQLHQQPEPDAEHDPEDDSSGFELRDEHECGLFEQGDQIVIRLRDGHTLEELQLPDLGPKHRYSAPAASLTRAGTLSEPPPYSIAPPNEPSSHSSSVAAQPNANYHQHSYHDYRQGYRVVTAAARRQQPTPPGLGNPGINLAQHSRVTSNGSQPARTRPKKERSASQPKILYSPPVSPNPNTFTSNNTNTTTSTTPTNPPASTAIQPQRRNSSSATAAAAATNGSSGAPSVVYGSGKAAGQAAMPLTALVIGPGVQGAVGRSAMSAATPIGSAGAAPVSGDDYGNANAFVGFTAASGEVRTRPKRKMSRARIESDSTPADSDPSTPTTTTTAVRRPSNPSAAAADAAERRAALARASAGGAAVEPRPPQDRKMSSSSNRSQPPTLPPIKNLAPFPEDAIVLPERLERDLPPMPMATSPTLQTKPDPPANGVSNGNGDSTPGAPVSPMEDLTISEEAPRSLSKAERRYNEIQKALAKEREKQAEAERLRTSEIREADERKKKEADKKELEAKQRAEQRKWDMWQEVRRRQRSAANSPTSQIPPAIRRLQSGESDVKPPSNERRASATRTVSAATTPTTASVAVTAPEAGPSSTSSASASAAAATGSTSAAAAAAGSSGPRIELGLERITRLLERLGSPQTRFPVIHVAGTNGKGSVVTYLDSILRNALDIRVGTFTSPHLIERRDSCKVGGEPIDRDVWRRAQADVLAADQGLEVQPTATATADDAQPLKASPFELLAAQTFQAFTLLPASEQPEVLVVEVGLGGRLDATNVFTDAQVLASVICPIARDHEAFLGSELAGIAREKAGIVKRGGLCVVADQRDMPADTALDQTALGPLADEAAPSRLGPRAAGILDAIRGVCMARGARLVKTAVPPISAATSTSTSGWVTLTPRLGPVLWHSTSGLNPPTTFVAHPSDPPIAGAELRLPATAAALTGATTALQTLWSISRDEGGPSDMPMRVLTGMLESARVVSAIEATVHRGRCHRVTWGGRDVLVDGAHNQHAVSALRAYVDHCTGGTGTGTGAVAWVTAFSEGRDALPLLQTLVRADRGDRLALTRFSTPVEGMPWVKAAPAPAWEGAHVAPSLRDALDWAVSATQGPIVVCGSLYLVADMYRLLS